MNALRDKTILVGVSGGIAAYKTCYLVSALVKCGASVYVMMTKNATNFVAPLTFETLSGNRVTVDTFDRDFTWEVEHVSLAKRADACVIAPATANVIAKLANGIADDFLTTTALACKCKMLIAPAMNTAMLQNPATSDNISTLVRRGYGVIYGVEGRLACGDVGCGRMAEPEDILSELTNILDIKKDLVGKRVLVTAGATRCDLDPVRFISNRSSGKMGFAVASAAYRRGAEIIFVKGCTDSFDIPNDWTVINAHSTDDMFNAVSDHVSDADIFVLAAAPFDYYAEKSDQKIKSDTLELSLKKAPDIAAFVGKNKKTDAKLVIFAAETHDCKRNAREKLIKKGARLAVLNDVTKPGAGFDTDTNIVTLITKDGECELPIMEKRALADVILDKIKTL